MTISSTTQRVVISIAVVLAAGCGSPSAPPSDRQWSANARGVVEQLRADVIAVSGFDRPGPARAGLRDESQLYGLLVSYSDFGGCRHMVAAVGVEPAGRARAVTLLDRACVHLQRADRLFTRAIARSAPPLLVAATRQAVAAVPVLDAAALELSRPVSARRQRAGRRRRAPRRPRGRTRATRPGSA